MRVRRRRSRRSFRRGKRLIRRRRGGLRPLRIGVRM